MKQVGCVISLSSSSAPISLDVWTKSNDKLIFNTYFRSKKSGGVSKQIGHATTHSRAIRWDKCTAFRPNKAHVDAE